MKFSFPEYPCHAIYNENGKIIKIVRNWLHIKSWCDAHCNGKRMTTKTIKNKYMALSEFDSQMKLGLSNLAVINDLLWWGGVSTTRTPEELINRMKIKPNV